MLATNRLNQYPDKIEIIDPTGNVSFVELPDAGVATIGSSAASDILLNSPGLDAVHAVLFYDTSTCGMLVYSEKTPTLLGEDDQHPLTTGTKHWLQDGDTLKINGYVLVYLRGNPNAFGNGYASEPTVILAADVTSADLPQIPASQALH